MKFKKLKACFITLLVIFSMSMPVMAETVSNRTIYITGNDSWGYTQYFVGRSGNYSYASARCHSVYPSSGLDTYTKIQCRILSSPNTVIMDGDYVLLHETDSSMTNIYIKEGYLNTSTVYFEFRGNSIDYANAVVSYSGN